MKSLTDNLNLSLLELLLLLFLILLVLSLWIYLNRWQKALHVACKNILVLEGLKKAAAKDKQAALKSS